MARRTKRRRSGEPTPKEVKHRRKNQRETQRLIFAAAGVIAVILLVLGFGFYQQNYAAPREPVAVVNGQGIATQDYQKRVSYQRFNLIRSFGGQLDQQTLVNYLQNQLPQIVLDSMIDEVLIEQKAAEDGIEVSKQEVQAEIEQQFGFTGDAATPTVAAGETVTTTTSAGSSMTREEFNTAYKNLLETLKTEAGMSEGDYRKIIREQLLRDKVQAAVTQDIPTTAEQVHARHILVETEEEAQQVRQRLLDGEDFATVAEEVSTDTQTASNGGDLGWFRRGDMVPEFEDVAFSLEPGTISEPVKTQFGYHIIEVLERDDNRPLTPTQLDQARQDRFSQWLDEQRAASDIQRMWTADVVPTLSIAPSSSQPTAPVVPPPAATQTAAP